jgi:hypothetical protein
MSTESSLPISSVTAHLKRTDLRRMMHLVRFLFSLSQSTAYRDMVVPQLPEGAQLDPGHAALMMGYDFHLTPSGPKLIEVNTNAGGAYIAWLSEQKVGAVSTFNKSPRYEQRLLQSFVQEWNDFSNEDRPLQRIVIIDEDPKNQPLYSEMQVCCNWLCEQGFDARVVAPQELNLQADGLYLQGEKIDLIYNRHCDFFLEDEVMAEIRSAYLDGTVCLSPNPFAYGLLADKRRMILWSDAEVMTSLGLDEQELKMLADIVPQSRLLRDCAEEDLWAERKGLIFKPVTRFGSRGVLLGKGITRKRFAELDSETTLVQTVVPPSVETGEDGRDFKVDLRLFVYRDHLVGIGARLYQGQVTNLRTEGGGFAPVRIV